MTDPDNEFSFEELRGIAKQIDKGVQNLEKKLSNVNNLGLSLPADDLKSRAIDVLNEYENEIRAMRENCEQCLEEEKKRLQDCIENNEKVSTYIEELKNDLDKWENIFIKSKNYQAFQYPSSKEILNDLSCVSEKSKNENTELESDHCTHGSSQCSIYSLEQSECVNQDATYGNLPQQNSSIDIGSLTINGSGCGDATFNISNDSIWNPLQVSKISNKHSEKSCESLDGCSNASATLPTIPMRDKTNQSKDVCKTPVDPGISLTSLKLLGRTDIKTKIFKTDLFETNFSKMK